MVYTIFVQIEETRRQTREKLLNTRIETAKMVYASYEMGESELNTAKSLGLYDPNAIARRRQALRQLVMVTMYEAEIESTNPTPETKVRNLAVRRYVTHLFKDFDQRLRLDVYSGTYEHVERYSNEIASEIEALRFNFESEFPEDILYLSESHADLCASLQASRNHACSYTVESVAVMKKYISSRLLIMQGKAPEPCAARLVTPHQNA